MEKVGAARFFSQVKQEVAKVTWPSRKETMMSTMMVLIMVSIVALFFFFVDSVVFHLIQAVLGF